MFNNEPITVLIADDQPLMVSSLSMILNSYDGIRVVATASNGNDAVLEADRVHIDVAVLDIQMPILDGITAAQKILQRHERTRVLILTTFDEGHLIEKAITSGVHGFMLKDTDPDALVAAIRQIHNGASILSPKITEFVLAKMREHSDLNNMHNHDDELAFQSLTEREVEVLQRIAHAESNAEIAEQLFISVETVKTYVSRLLAKLHVRDRVGLAVWAHTFGIDKLIHSEE